MEKMVKNFYKKKKILITGATGFKGAWLSYWLFLLNSNILGLGYKPNNNQDLFKSLKLQNKINLKYLDIRNYKKLDRVVKNFKPEIIFHLAAQPLIFDAYKNPYSSININTLGTLNILDITKKCPFIKALVCVTSDKCYANNFSTKGFQENDKLGGDDPYSASKACAEILINSYYQSYFKNSNTGVASARAGNVIGGGDWSGNRLIPDCVNSLVNKKEIILRRPNYNRPWQHVLEPLNGYLMLAKNLYKNPNKFSGPWNFGSKKNTTTSVHQVVKKIVKYWGSGKIKLKNRHKYYEQENLQLNITKSFKQLNWQPILSIDESIKQTIIWYKNVQEKKISAESITTEQIKQYINANKKNKIS
jgi:CDP-glucose 4,6-dehydratase